MSRSLSSRVLNKNKLPWTFIRIQLMVHLYVNQNFVLQTTSTCWLCGCCSRPKITKEWSLTSSSRSFRLICCCLAVQLQGRLCEVIVFLKRKDNDHCPLKWKPSLEDSAWWYFFVQLEGVLGHVLSPQRSAAHSHNSQQSVPVFPSVVQMEQAALKLLLRQCPVITPMV